MLSKLVFITGANTGIGYETVKALVQSEKSTYHILIGTRTLAKAYSAIENMKDLLAPSCCTVEAIQIDVGNNESVKAAVKQVQERFGWLDILINNAGISLDTTFSEDASNFRSLFNKSYNVNVTGAQVLTSLFVPLLIRSPYARLVFLTSSNASLSAVSEGLIPAWTPEPEDGWPKGEIAAIQSYACSKAAVNMCMLTWHHMLKYDRVKTFAVNPGLLATHLGGQTPASMRELGAEDPAVAGELIRKVVEGERDADVGKIITQHGVQEW